MINLSNSLFNGDLGAHNRKPSIPPSDQCKAARQLAVEATLREASAFARDRRRFFLTGGHRRPMETLIKGLARDTNGYFHRIAKPPQVPLVADLVAEPTHDRTIDMLEALPSSESCLYSDEHLVIDTVGKCPEHVAALTEQYGFYGGSINEVIRYFKRPDLPASMWRCALFS